MVREFNIKPRPEINYKNVIFCFALLARNTIPNFRIGFGLDLSDKLSS